MALRVALSNFSRGEIAPDLYGRFDVASYNAALKRARNVVVLKTGAVTMRPGTRFVGEVYDSTQAARLVPFQFSLDQTYALEFGQGTMRPAALGGYVLEGEQALLGATHTNPVILNIPYHGYAIGDDVFISGVLGMTELNGRTFRVVNVGDANHVSIAVDGSNFHTFTGCGGGVSNSGPPTPPPTPPTVPPVVPPPAPPDVRPPSGGGGHGGGDIP